MLIASQRSKWSLINKMDQCGCFSSIYEQIDKQTNWKLCLLTQSACAWCGVVAITCLMFGGKKTLYNTPDSLISFMMPHTTYLGSPQAK